MRAVCVIVVVEIDGSHLSLICVLLFGEVILIDLHISDVVERCRYPFRLGMYLLEFGRTLHERLLRNLWLRRVKAWFLFVDIQLKWSCLPLLMR